MVFVFGDISAQENTSILCADGIDNDGDGMIDCEDVDCTMISMQGCDLCSEGISFADYLIEYKSGCSIADPEPEGALGASDFKEFVGDEPEFVFLGDEGFIKLGFSNNLVTNSGDGQLDLWLRRLSDRVPLGAALFDALAGTLAEGRSRYGCPPRRKADHRR